MLSKKPDPARLSFGSQQDALDYAVKCVEDSLNWLADHDVNLAKRYERGDCHVVTELSSRFYPQNLHLVLCAVPPRDINVGRTAQLEVIDGEFSGVRGHRANKAMFVGITKLVQGPQHIIPSAIWLERFHEREDFIRNLM